MADNDKQSIDELWLKVLTGRESVDVTGQFLDKEQLEILEEAELLHDTFVALDRKQQAQAEADDFDIEKSKDKLIDKLKQKGLL